MRGSTRPEKRKTTRGRTSLWREGRLSRRAGQAKDTNRHKSTPGVTGKLGLLNLLSLAPWARPWMRFDLTLWGRRRRPENYHSCCAVAAVAAQEKAQEVVGRPRDSPQTEPLHLDPSLRPLFKMAAIGVPQAVPLMTQVAARIKAGPRYVAMTLLLLRCLAAPVLFHGLNLSCFRCVQIVTSRR